MIFQIKEFLDRVFYPFYILRGRRPWTPGYYTAKRRRIESAIENGLLKPAASLPTGYGFRMDERVIEYPWVYALAWITPCCTRRTERKGKRTQRAFERLCGNSGALFVREASVLFTAPYGKACQRGWFQVFDATMIRAVLDDYQPAHTEVDYFAYSPDGWHASDPAALAEATFFDIHQEKRFSPDYAAAARGLICMRLVA